MNRVQPTDGRMIGLINKSITGVINSERNLSAMTELVANDLEPERCEGSCNILVSEGPVVALVEASGENDDVGDSVQFIPGTNGEPNRFSGVSDAPCFVVFEKERQ